MDAKQYWTYNNFTLVNKSFTKPLKGLEVWQLGNRDGNQSS